MIGANLQEAQQVDIEVIERQGPQTERKVRGRPTVCPRILTKQGEQREHESIGARQREFRELHELKTEFDSDNYAGGLGAPTGDWDETAPIECVIPIDG